MAFSGFSLSETYLCFQLPNINKSALSDFANSYSNDYYNDFDIAPIVPKQSAPFNLQI